MFDSHTHILKRNAIVNIDPVDLIATPAISNRKPRPTASPILRKGYFYSIGIHPWNYLRVTPASLRLIRSLAAEPQVLAIGECGLDTICNSGRTIGSGIPSISRSEIIEAQTALLHLHYTLSETLGKPLILHIVKAFPEIITLKNQWSPTQPWIIHGFRGKPQLARELLSHGFHLSFGKKYNPASLALTPPARLLRETDFTDTDF